MILVTIDVVGLYPHIPHNEGLEAIRKILNTRTNQEIPTDDIVNLAELVLKNSNFEFDGKHFLQKHGTAIGMRMVPAYANIFMHELESQLLDLDCFNVQIEKLNISSQIQEFCQHLNLICFLEVP